MVAGIFHKGSGVGNQLHRYVATRVLALDKGYEFSMVAPELCKVKDFMNLDMGVDIFSKVRYQVEANSGKVLPIVEAYDAFTGLAPKMWEEKTPYYNPEFNFIEDNTIIDGEFQDERYFGHRMSETNEWLKVEPIDVPDDVCVIGFRGGEFYVFPELGLPKEWFETAITEMKKIHPKMKFEVHTDDEILARQFFPDFKIIHDVGINWRSMRYAKYAIIANSSFYIIPRLLRHNDLDDWDGVITYAPRYWDRHNTKKWERPYNYYKRFWYI